MRNIFPKVFKGEKTMNYFGAGQIPQKVGRVGQRAGQVLPKIMILGLPNGSSSVLKTDDTRICPPPHPLLLFWLEIKRLCPGEPEVLISSY